jgi:phosphoribosylformimino-5-aminoimidazole carboxamide ribotide isomerase
LPVRVIPVLDVLAGRAVHAVAGNRAHYGSLRSAVHAGSDPRDLARAYRDRLGLRTIYLADLDAIAGAPPALELYRDLHSIGFDLWVDAGIRQCAGLRPLLDEGVSTIVLGLETLHGPETLIETVAAIGSRSLLFSLDLRGGVPLTAPGADWGSRDPLEIAETVIDHGVRRLLLLDLARVGTGRGVGTLALLDRLAADHRNVEFSVGGGISSALEIRSLENHGASAVLIGSALYDGRIGRIELDDLARGLGPAP